MDVAINKLLESVSRNGFWMRYLSEAANPKSLIGVHVAVFSEPFLSLVLSGKKTVESRFSRNRCAPYGEVSDGDVILIKQVAGPIRGISLARRSWYFDLVVEPIDRIRYRFGTAVCADDAFWSTRTDAAYATLIELDATTEISPVRCGKRDRRGWVSLRSPQLGFDFA